MTSELGVVAAGFGLSLAFFFGCWVWGMLHDRDASVTDAFYGMSSLAQGGLTFVLWHRHTARGAILLGLAGVWSIGLGQMLFRRWRKNHATGGDARYVMAVEKFNPGKNLWWITLLTLVLAQAVFVTVLNLPLVLAITSPVHGIAGLDVLGYVVIAVGGTLEIVSNYHLERFKRDPANGGKTLMSGLWGWSRHPNYFGNVLVYFGFFIVAMRHPALWWTAAGPLAIYGLLRFGSGVRLTEYTMLQKRKDDPVYLDYLARTSPFMVRPPRRKSQQVVPTSTNSPVAP